MKWLKQSVGLLVAVLAAIGTVACLAGVLGVWTVRARVDEAVERIVVRVDGVLTRLEDGARQTKEIVAEVHESARQFNARVQQRVAELRGVPTDEAADIDQIERQLYARIQRAADLIALMQAGADLIEQMLQMLESAAVLVKRESQAREDLLATIRAGYEEIQRTVKLVDDVSQCVEQLEESADIEENARRITTLSERLDASLTTISGVAADFETGIADLRADVGGLGNDVRRWLMISATIATLLLVWLAVAQLSLAWHGWKLFRRRTILEHG
jgi:hypothetical protein